MIPAVPPPDPRRLPAPALLLLDFDGTLVPIAPTPDGIEVPDGTDALLAGLSDAGHEVVVVTGRRAAFVTERLPGTTVVGMHGLEWPGEPEPARHALLDDAVGAGEAWAARWPGSLVEDKGLAVALHWRGVDEARHSEASTEAVATLAPVAEASDGALIELQGHCVAEVRPAAASKGEATRRLLLAHPRLHPVMIGDDRTDEEAFTVLPEHAWTVRVAPENVPSDARFRLPDPAAVHRWLSGFLRDGSRGPSGSPEGDAV